MYLQIHLQNFRKKPKNHPQGARGGGRSKKNLPDFLRFFLGARANILNPTTTPSLVLNDSGKKRKMEKYLK
jgi:hypothetical protein